MSLDHAILGLLHPRPQTGYDLKKTFDRSMSHFWPAQQSQIYRTLTRLEEKALVTSEIVPQQGRPSRKLYALTPAGRRALKQWLAVGERPGPWRSSFLVRLYLSGLQSDEAASGLLTAELEWARVELRDLEDLATRPAGSYAAAHPREAFFWYLPLGRGLEALRFHIAWLEGVVERVRLGRYERGKVDAVENEGRQ
jgi:PadR family transcriptional regulator, regulatory protein AphA